MNEGVEALDEIRSFAVRFLNHTSMPVFLTGKAGTGKTTFLKALKSFIYKPFIVVAPTGIAALNADGVTIHSQFLLPRGVFLPGRYQQAINGTTYTQQILARSHPLNAVRRKLLNAIELLVIDEVSMLRADTLDAIDYRLRSVRNNFQKPFGGVQVLFIGDLFQLPPVIQKEDEHVYNKFYPAPWFYHANAFKEAPSVYLELTTIFRQNDLPFISLLNKLRMGTYGAEEREFLNRYCAEVDTTPDAITLTTHNWKADKINAAALSSLPGEPVTFHASIDGEFPTPMFPVAAELILKPGSKIMFIRNDVEERAYYNGKLATINAIRGKEILVEFEDGRLYTLKQARWENKKYTLDKFSGMPEEEVIGEFRQYPIRLAWAITVHKSQGLTFDKAVIDLSEAFTGGQVYVALSRLRSLEGLILTRPIADGSVVTNPEITAFTQVRAAEDAGSKLETGMELYLVTKLESAFTFLPLVRILQVLKQRCLEENLVESMRALLAEIQEEIAKEEPNTNRFLDQLKGLLPTDRAKFRARLTSGVDYYVELLKRALTNLNALEAELDRKFFKELGASFSEADHLIFLKLREVAALPGVMAFQLGEIQTPDGTVAAGLETFHRQLLARREVKKKGKKPATELVTKEHLESGLSPEEIAVARELKLETIEAHLMKLVQKKLVDIHDFISEPEIMEIQVAFDANKEQSITELFNRLQGKFRYGTVRCVVAFLRNSSLKNP